MKSFVAIFLFINFSLVFGQSPKISIEHYILLNKNLAISEMYRTGVPASITLAQAILESQSGNSRLAKEANNHFGIKCKAGWTGRSVRADDDDTAECFRAYESVIESYKDHSDFLRTNWRYKECFNLENTDCKGWAEGLRKAGYATNPKYHTLIMGLIERYELHQYDLAPAPEGVKPEYEVKNKEIPLVIAGEGETAEAIAEKNDLSKKQIYRYNDLPKGTAIEPGDIIYLKPKRRKGSEPYHVVKEGENIYDLSQVYGIKLKHLYKKNKLEDGDEVVAGTKLYLQKKRDDKPATLSKEQFERLEKEKKQKEEAIIKQKETPKKIEIYKEDSVETTNSINREYHIIKVGDNLYRISEKYHVFVEDILEWNGITSPEGIAVGDKIYLTKESAAKAGSIKQATPEKPTDKTTSSAKTHVVEKGETAYKICKTYGITTNQLVEWNQLKDAGSIREGQKLKVRE